MKNKNELIERLKKWRWYYFRCVECALANNAHEFGGLLNDTVDYIERTSDLLDQVRWERDVAIEQLNNLGISLGEKLDTRGEEFGIRITCQRCGKQTFRKNIGLDNFKPIPKGWKVNKDYYHNGWWCPDCVKEYTI